MKNFHMPEIISPTLEAKELERLHKSITLIRSKKEADHIVSSLPLSNDSTPEERAAWVENLSILLEDTYDTNTIKQIRQHCHCTSGYGKHFFGIVFGISVDAEIVT